MPASWKCVSDFVGLRRSVYFFELELVELVKLVKLGELDELDELVKLVKLEERMTVEELGDRLICEELVSKQT
jgi:hypothetical protein